MEWTYLAPILLSTYFVVITGVSLLGGKLSLVISMTHTQMQVLMSFISGFIIGIAIHHLLLHSIEYISGPESVETAVSWMLLGIIAIVLLLRTFHFHQHEPMDEVSQPSSRGCDSSHESGGVKTTSLLSIIVGLSLHSVMDGVALGSSIHVDMDLSQSGGHLVLGSLGVLLAIVLHKPLDAYSIIGMMGNSGYSQRACKMVNLLFAILCPLMMVATFGGITLLDAWNHREFIGCLLAFASGTFLCIALSDLLPEIQFHRHDRVKLTLAFLIGICLSYFLHFLAE